MTPWNGCLQRTMGDTTMGIREATGLLLSAAIWPMGMPGEG